MPQIELVNPLIEQYAEAHTSPESDILRQVNASTYATHKQAHMLSGHVQGKLLSFISNMLRPKYVLEIGTFTGYSALCLADGLQSGGQLHTIELREEEAETSLKNFIAAKKDKHITLHRGNAMEIIPQIPHLWDLVFLDADKTGYINYYEIIVPRLSSNGFIIADNTFFHGEVIGEPVKGKNALAIDAFNKHVLNDDRVEQVMLTVRDGLLMIKKK